MKKICWLLLLLCGCASNPAPQDSTPSNQVPETSARNRARIHTDLGSGYYAQGRLAVSLEEFSTAESIDPTYAPTHNGLGLVYAALKEDEKAEAHFKRAIALDAGSSESHNNYGTFLCGHNRIDESIREFLQALKNPLYTTPESAWMNAGICALKKNDAKNAEIYLKNALEIQPGLVMAHYQLAALYYNKGEKALAYKHIQPVMQQENLSAEMLWMGVRIARLVEDRNAESSYSMQLRHQYPDSTQVNLLDSSAGVQQ